MTEQNTDPVSGDIVLYENLKSLDLQSRIQGTPFTEVIQQKMKKLRQKWLSGKATGREVNNLAVYKFELGETEEARELLFNCWDIVREKPKKNFNLFCNVARNLARFTREGVPNDSTLTSSESPSTTEKPHTSPVFIGGSGRCGTTLLKKVLDDHSSITAFGETDLTDSVFFIVFCNQLADLDRDDRHEFLREFKLLLLTTWFRHPIEDVGDWHWGLSKWFDRDDLRQEFHLLDECVKFDDPGRTKRQVGRYFHRLFGQLTDSNDQIWIEKNPRNLNHISLLNNMFTDMKFIHMYRDGRDVICSRVTHIADLEPPYRPSPQTINNGWTTWMIIGLSQLSHISPEQFFTVRYEDLVQSPESTLLGLCNFLGVSFEETLIDRTFRTDSIGRYKDELSRDACDYLEEEYGDLLRLFGYRCPPGDTSFNNILSSLSDAEKRAAWARTALHTVRQINGNPGNGTERSPQEFSDQELLKQARNGPGIEEFQIEALEQLYGELLS